MSENPKLCKDCKHCIPDRSWWWFAIVPFLIPALLNYQWRYARCRRLRDRRYGHLFTGERITERDRFRSCSIAREFDDYCGPDAKYFEAKR